MCSVMGLFSYGTKAEETVKSCPIQVVQPEQKSGDILLSRKIINHLDRSNLDIRLYQYETCPFCCKVRAFLDYYGFSYEAVEVNPVTRSQIKFSIDYKKVPIMKCGGFNVTESSLIISQLATFLQRKDRTFEEIQQMYPAVESSDEKGKKVMTYPSKYFIMLEKVTSTEDMARQKEEREWRMWVDDHFIHLISPNVYRTWNEALNTFKWFSLVGDWDRTFPAWERYLAIYMGAAAMYMISKRLKKKHNIDDERQALRDACKEWMEAIGKDRLFMGGDKPNLADLALYGAMTSFYGCEAFEEVKNGPAGEWWERMRKAVNNHEGRKILELRAA
ncbi:hypothetical protein WR25_09519 [Diploscapter pachys]|uniref:Prostaglandin E synthase 2 n=1 Tax=Diploscapter pachys TaxID=2018661 RepID=A0A2A2J3Q9_9BILA|nr:hypothetical protein WR25_09519 [Diploscapter pachys]